MWQLSERRLRSTVGSASIDQQYEFIQWRKQSRVKQKQIIVLVVGDITVGKTTSLRRLAQRPTISKAVPTVAVEFYAAELTVGDRSFRLHFWDTSGQRCYWHIAMSYVDKMDAVVVMYDLTSFASLHCARELIDMIYQRKRLPVLLFGNKLDLCGKGQGREVTVEAASVIQGVDGILSEGSGFIDHSFERGLQSLLKEYFCQGIAFEGQQKVGGCCC